MQLRYNMKRRLKSTYTYFSISIQKKELISTSFFFRFLSLGSSTQFGSRFFDSLMQISLYSFVRCTLIMRKSWIATSSLSNTPTILNPSGISNLTLSYSIATSLIRPWYSNYFSCSLGYSDQHRYKISSTSLSLPIINSNSRTFELFLNSDTNFILYSFSNIMPFP